eukprot:TRINITY_DN3538_c0_g2_i2.p1 TRINITY_DN3538_c0_g2~~TRINITY_DN3538_c0_g2_i2.p1  ORF type:complete len:244 (+),score=43.57 TRINITY_DN3538_c0_g2_i2:111-842(+)
MGIRSAEAGQKVLKEFQEAFPDLKDKLFVGQLEVSDSTSIDNFTKWVATTFGKVDVLLNNAAIYKEEEEFNYTNVSAVFQTNLFGTIELTEKLLPYINDSGKIIMVSSKMGSFSNVKSAEIRGKLESSDLTTLNILDYGREIVSEVRENKFNNEKWAKSAYSLTKLFLSLWVRVFAKSPEVISRKHQVYSCCPGWVRTDMGGPNATKSIKEGSECPLYLVNLPFTVNPGFQGQFFSNCAVASL